MTFKLKNEVNRILKYNISFDIQLNMQGFPENIIELVTSRGALSNSLWYGIHLGGIVGEFCNLIRFSLCTKSVKLHLTSFFVICLWSQLYFLWTSVSGCNKPVGLKWKLLHCELPIFFFLSSFFHDYPQKVWTVIYDCFSVETLFLLLWWGISDASMLFLKVFFFFF